MSRARTEGFLAGFLACSATLWPAVASCGLKSQPETLPAVALKAVADAPDRYLQKTFRVTGKLENEGTNYFTDLRLVVKDDQGSRLYVRPWLPIETPPGPPGRAKPPTLSQFMGKRVELTATLERGSLKRVGEVYLLLVRAAQIVPQ